MLIKLRMSTVVDISVLRGDISNESIQLPHFYKMGNQFAFNPCAAGTMYIHSFKQVSDQIKCH